MSVAGERANLELIFGLTRYIDFIMFFTRLTTCCLLASIAFCSSARSEIVTFENLLGAKETFFKGGTSQVNNDPWSVDGFEFSNRTTFVGFWSGWAYSNTTDSSTAGFANEHSAAPGGGSNGAGGVASGETYALAFDGGAVFNLPKGALLQSVDWTNGTYPFLSMANGDTFAKKFGGATGTDPDFFRAILTGRSELNGLGAATGSVTLDLADFTFANSAQDYIVDSWQANEDLTALGSARSVSLSFESSDTGAFGINTPKFLFIDNLQYSITAVPEPTSALLLALISGVVVTRRRR